MYALIKVEKRNIDEGLPDVKGKCCQRQYRSEAEPTTAGTTAELL